MSNDESMKHVISSHLTNVSQNAWHPIGCLQYNDRANCEGKMGEKTAEDSGGVQVSFKLVYLNA